MSRIGRYFSRRGGLRDFMEAGPYANILDELAAGLEADGISTGTIAKYLRGARHATWCMEQGRLRRSDLTLARLRKFAKQPHDTCGCPRPEGPTSNTYSVMMRLVPILQDAGLAAKPKRPRFAAETEEFCSYLRETKGLADETLRKHSSVLGNALRALMPRGVPHIGRLRLSAINALILRTVEEGHVKSAQAIAESMRALGRYLLATGQGAPFEVSGICAPKQKRYSPSGKALTVPQLRLLLRPLRVDSVTAARDFAVLLLLARTGLRRSDVARASLADFNAREKTLQVGPNKSRRLHVVPLPQDVIDAILQYVGKYRRSTACRALFLSEGFPYDTGLSASAVGALVARAFTRSGISHTSRGPHVLRHTLATHLVASKVHLKAVADVLIHKSIDTTTKYARIDMDRLRDAVQPWSVPLELKPRKEV